MKRAKYFSDDDWSIGRALERAKKVLAEYESGAQCSDINSALEPYNIQKLFQIGVKLPDWSEEYFRQLTQKAAGHTSTIGAFWKTVEDKNFTETYRNTENLYRDNFWEEFERHKTCRRVSKETFDSFLRTEKPSIKHILRQREVVREYGQELAEHMRGDPQSAELLLDHYLNLHKSPCFECKATTSYAGANYFALAFSLRAKRDDKLIAYHIERKYGFGTLLVYEP